MLKKILMGLAGLLGLLVIAAIVIPLVVDVDKFRPKIVEIANQNINGKLELGKLTLSLWGRILVKVDGVNLEDSTGNKVVSVKDAFFHVPFSSVLGGSPVLTFKMTDPSVFVRRDKAGKLNVMTLVKAAPAAASPGSAAGTPTAPSVGTPAQQPSAGTTQVALPALVTRARLGVELLNASVKYQDDAMALTNDLNGLNLKIKDLSMSRPTELELWADLNTKMGKTMEVKGPFKITALAKPVFNGAEFQSAQASVNANFDGIDINMPGTFHKSNSIPAHAALDVALTQKDVKISKFEVVFNNVTVQTEGQVNQTTPSPTVQIQTASNAFSLGPWVPLIPALKDFELSGTTEFKASVNGPSDHLNYTSTIKFSDWSAKAPMLKAKPVINGVIEIATDQIQKILVSLKAPGNDMTLTGNMKSFSKPQLRLALNSSGMDLDQWIDFPAPKAAKAAPAAEAAAPAPSAQGAAPSSAESSAPAPSGAAGAPAAADFDALLDPLRSNEMARATSAEVTANFAFLKAYGVEIKNIQTKITFKDLVASVESLKMALWDGTVSAAFSTHLKPKQPTYSLNAQVLGLQIEKAVASQFQLFKNTMTGKADFSVKGTGASFNPTSATKNLNLQGNLKVSQATFATVDVGRMTKEALNGAIEKLGDKIPQAKGKKINNIPSHESKYELVSSDFSIQNGIFKAPNFVGKAVKNQGLDLEGRTQAGLIDFSLDAKWSIIDRYNMTKAQDFSIDVSGVQVEHVLAKGNPPIVSFPVSVGCKMTAPCYNYSEVPEYLAGIALSNISGAVKGKVQSEAKKKVQEQIQKVIPQDKLPEPAKNLLKKFGF